jgi:hypothetical protein
MESRQSKLAAESGGGAGSLIVRATIKSNPFSARTKFFE